MMSEDSLARLAIAWEACQLAETAGDAVTVTDDPSELLARAHEVLEAAERYAATVHAFTCQQVIGATDRFVREHPEEAAGDLDDWVLRHRDGEVPAPVSRHLFSRSGP